jgi:helix-turn-helix protein
VYLHVRNDLTMLTNMSFATEPVFNRMVAAQTAAKVALFSDPLLNLVESSTVLGCSVPTLRLMIKAKKIPVWRSSPKGPIKIRASALAEFLKAGAQ